MYKEDLAISNLQYAIKKQPNQTKSGGCTEKQYYYNKFQ